MALESRRLIAALVLTGLAAGGCADRSVSGTAVPAGVPGTVERGTGPMGAADGVVDGSVSVTANVPAITKLKPALQRAIRAAAQGAAERGTELSITSGWRSERYQQSLYDDAVQRQGADAASRLVAPAASSEHVTGDAVDVGPTEAAYWLSRNGDEYGLCRIYENEVWHYELRSGHGCPDLVADASERQR